MSVPERIRNNSERLGTRFDAAASAFRSVRSDSGRARGASARVDDPCGEIRARPVLAEARTESGGVPESSPTTPERFAERCRTHSERYASDSDAPGTRSCKPEPTSDRSPAMPDVLGWGSSTSKTFPRLPGERVEPPAAKIIDRPPRNGDQVLAAPPFHPARNCVHSANPASASTPSWILQCSQLAKPTLMPS